MEAPKVRFNEFEQLAIFANLTSSKNLLEVSAEIGMLEQVYPNSKIDRADWLKIAIPEADGVVVTDFELNGIKSNYYDAVLGVAPFHHANLEQKSSYIAGAMRVLQTGGVLAFGEVAQDSKEDYFLDDFIHSCSPSGHQGMYVDQSFIEVLSQHGFMDVRSEFRACPWVFDSISQMLGFIKNLFNINGIDKSYLLKQLDSYLGIKENNGKIFLNWNLRYFMGVKHHSS